MTLTEGFHEKAGTNFIARIALSHYRPAVAPSNLKYQNGPLQ